MSERLKITAGIIARMRLDASEDESTPDGILGQTLNYFADLLEAAHRREADNIHRAMVILAGIEMIDPDYPPRLWTALEDAYDALSDAIGMDGCTTSDEEEAKSIGRHFVIQPFGDSAKLREALAEARRFVWTSAHRTDRDLLVTDDGKRGPYVLTPKETLIKIDAALAAPPRNCDLYDSYGDAIRAFEDDENAENYEEMAEWLFAPATETEGGAK